MIRRITSGIVILMSMACLLSMAGASRTLVAAQVADADAHKGWMNDASDAQEDYRFALADKDMKAAADALVKLESLMGRTEDYWAAKKAADGVKLSRDARTQAAQALALVKAANVAAASEAFEKMGATCNACHELHLEKK